MLEGSGLNLSLQTQDFIRGGQGKVKFLIENTTPVEIEIVTASNQNNENEIKLFLLNEDEDVLAVKALKQKLGNNVITLPNGKTVARIPPAALNPNGQKFPYQLLRLLRPNYN